MIEIELADAQPNWKVSCRSSLGESLKDAPFSAFDCILSDLGLPDASGIESVLRLKSWAPDKALVVLTSLDDERVAQEAIRAGAQDYVVKSDAGLTLLPRVIRHAIERQEGQAALEASHRTSQALLDASHDIAMLLDAEGHILTLNTEAEQYLNAPPDAVIGQSIFDLLPLTLAEHRRSFLAEALESGRTVQFEDTDGIHWFANRLLAVAGVEAGEHRFAIFSRDITGERANAATLAEAKEEADFANRAKTEFMGRMSRDIRTPLNDVIGFAELISTEMLGPLAQAGYREYAEAILNSGSQILKLLDRITDVSMLESALLKDQASYRDLVELSPDLICVCVDGIIERINAAGLGMLRAPSVSACEGKHFSEFIHPDYRAIFEGGLDTLYEEGHPLPVKVVTFAGRVRDVEVSAVPLRREARNATLLVGRDTTEVTAAMRAVAAREHRIRAIMDTVLDGIVTIDEDGTILNANLSVERIFGHSLSELIGANVSILMPEPDAGHHDGYIKNYLSTGIGAIIGIGREVMGKRKDGSLFPVHLSISELRVEKRRLFTGTIRDLTENKQLAQRVAYLANHDPLTDLPNRSLLTDRLGQAVAMARSAGLLVAIITVDLDGFTTINDSMGHDVGNSLLRETARRLAQAVGAGGTAARLAGDEFAVVVPQTSEMAEITAQVTQIHDILNKPYTIHGTEMVVPVDMGVSVFPRDGDDAQELLRNAEMALHNVKRRTDLRMGFFDAAMSFAVTERMTLERSVKDALRSGQFELFYQPQVRLSDYALIGAEALIRWRHPELGIITPDKFIPVAEETGLIVPLGTWVLHQACDQLRRWNDLGLTGLRLGVNISGRQFREADLADIVADCIAESGVSPGDLDLELTESMLMTDGEGTLKLLRSLAKLGVTLSIDDFGTGYSSLAYLKRFPVDTVKIDRAFVRDLDQDEDGRVLVNAIISLAHSLSLKTIAEGVETESQASLLARHGCDEIQGYMIGRPMPVADFAEFAKSYCPRGPEKATVLRAGQS
ncbi:diguanylate cyclase/phosphodiesterase (GGDEF & EAL domains) with PAS/PAC sensor(s) [Paramagnetospirillum magnetotacticum MS-1]|uniref:Sensor protein FixL n=1 Tax=Paramagnetospirillum magnetotacticum MS-1 TaxID=272627 RepID=A0A0C2U7W1_PARME|nr:diguanylate cyclase/phosphodiesterase (GGDEF & EAL domains) with PAS/PAC sensor(s) [Paramagnetospirillum magnetotacticum MS-1]